MKDFYAPIVLFIVDSIIIALSIIIGYGARVLLDDSFNIPFDHALSIYLSFSILYIIPLSMLAYEGVYSRRYDFWHESRQIIKSLILSFVLILAFLAMTQDIYGYSRAVIAFIFIVMLFFLPFSKYFLKPYLYRIGLWQRKASVHSQDTYFKEEIFGNAYLGYIEANSDDSQTIFIDSYQKDIKAIKDLIETELQRNHEVLFIPLINEYDLTNSFIYNLSTKRRNLIVYKNRLKSRYRTLLKKVSDFLLTLFLLPFLIPIMLFIVYKVKRDEPNQKIFFKQKRIGKNAKIFSCYKFQTMYEDSDKLLKDYLNEHPDEISHYSTYHKYRHDPRITKIGSFLRRTSLDELPQIFNVFRGDMSFIGPRPYMLDEENKIGKEIDTILSVKPGITGLWQVSGRSEVDFSSRVSLDVWYIRNWNLWMDIVILLKTIKTVLLKDGAQ